MRQENRLVRSLAIVSAGVALGLLARWFLGPPEPPLDLPMTIHRPLPAASVEVIDEVLLPIDTPLISSDAPPLETQKP